MDVLFHDTRSFSSNRRVPLLLAAIAAVVAGGVASAVTASASADARRYSDPVGDQAVEPRCGDISGLIVSNARGVIALTVDIRSFMCGEVIVTLDTDHDGHWDYDLGFRRNANARKDIDHFWPIGSDDSIGRDASWKISSVWHHGDAYTFRFRARALGIKRAFKFEAHLNGRYMSDVVDRAPNYPKDWFTYRLTAG